jgi:hypothetical protein
MLPSKDSHEVFHQKLAARPTGHKLQSGYRENFLMPMTHKEDTNGSDGKVGEK